MKQPRTSDFDPNAKEHELKSSLDGYPSIEKPGQPATTDNIRPTVPPVLPVRPVRDVLSPIENRRKMKQRHPFDIYADQYDELKQLALDDRMRGGVGSMSAMVREAIDDYISKVRGN